MSIVNTTVHPDRVLILTDSESLTQDGARRRVAKLFALPHIGAVMTGVGDATMLGAFWMRITLGPTPFESFDAVADVFGAAMREGHRGALAAMQAKGAQPGEDFVHFSMTIAGYSDRAGRMLAHSFAADADFEPQTIEEGTLAHPADPAWIDELYSPDLESMARLAARQLAWLKERQPGAAGGGPLIGATLTREQLVIRQLGAISPT